MGLLFNPETPGIPTACWALHANKKMKPIAIIIFLLLTLPLSTPPVVAQVYKWVDDQGVTHYTNRKPKVKFKVRRLKCSECDWKRRVDWSNVPLNTGDFSREIAAASKKYNVDPALVRAVIHAESAFNQRAVSDMGAQGLMQLMPAKQKEYGVTRPFDPGQNIDGGVRYLAFLLDKFDGNRSWVAAGYNAGENAVVQYGGVPPYDETQNFVKRVSILQRRYSRTL